ncbi:MAG: hypothetical protein ABFD84_01635, partial [Candidatus Polarisedimenticolia bacterium]
MRAGFVHKVRRPTSRAGPSRKFLRQRVVKAGATYEVRLENLVSDAGIGLAGGQPIVGRFTVYAGAVLGRRAYDDVTDVVRRGAVLYVAAGAQGFDVVDVSDPTNPTSVVNGPVPTLGAARGVAFAGSVPVSEGGVEQARNVAVVVGGGENGQPGFVQLRYADFPHEDAEDGQAPQSAAIGDLIGGALLTNPVGSELDGPQGLPLLVRAIGTTAFVATNGAGLQQVDLAAVARKNTYAVQNTIARFTYPAGSGAQGAAAADWEISNTISGLAVLPPQADPPTHGYVVGSVRNRGIAAWDVSVAGGLAGPVAAGYAAFPARNASGGLRMEIAPGYAYEPAGGSSSLSTNLLVVAGGSAGVLLYELSPEPAGGNESAAALHVALRGVVPLPAGVGAFDVALDARRRIAYVACYNAGVAVVDSSDPYRSLELLDADGNGV